MREHIDKLQAEADIATELEADSLDDKLAAIREKAVTDTAQNQLDELKKQMAARKAAEQGQKTI